MKTIIATVIMIIISIQSVFAQDIETENINEIEEKIYGEMIIITPETPDFVENVEQETETTTNNTQEVLHWADSAVLNLQKHLPEFKPVDKSLYNTNMTADEFYKNLHLVFNQKYIQKYLPKTFQYVTREEASFAIQNIINPTKTYIDYNLYSKVKDLKNADYWAKKGIEEMLLQNLILLDKNNNFNPKKYITYAEGYTIINNILNKNYNVSQEQFFDGVNKTYKILNIQKTPFQPKTSGLANKLKGLSGVSVYYKDLYSNKEYKYNTKQEYGISSIGKAPYITYVYYLASINKISLDDKIVYKPKHRKGGSGVLKDRKTGGSYTIRELCGYAIKDSDNTAISMLTEKVPVSQYKNFLKSIGYRDINKIRYVTGADVSAEDLMFFMEHINDFIENNKYGNELKQDMLKAGTPFIVSDKYEIARKSGWWLANFHDMGIVYADRPYILVICSNKSGNFKLFKDISYLVEKFLE